jgi:hypothetical protein
MCKCGGNKKKASAQKKGFSIMAQNLIPKDDPDFIEVVYSGKNYGHWIYSATGVLKQYRITNYGYHTNGAHLRVHVKDVEAEPHRFERMVSIEEVPDETPPPEPKAEEPKSEEPEAVEPEKKSVNPEQLDPVPVAK